MVEDFKVASSKKTEECFVIMPIADLEGYSDGHFGHVYDNIIKPACYEAGYKAVRADDVKETNLIHLDILRKLIEAPMAVCDLSARNPNVLFELGIRQAFDKPVVLIQETGTPKIFDIAPLRYTEYSKEMKYHDVLEVQALLKEAIEATAKAESDPDSVNSIVRLLALSSSAQIPDLKTDKEAMSLNFLTAEIRDMKKMMDQVIRGGLASRKRNHSIAEFEYQRISRAFDKLLSASSRINMSPSEKHERLHSLVREAENIMHSCESEAEHMHFRRLLERVHNDAANFLDF